MIPSVRPGIGLKRSLASVEKIDTHTRHSCSSKENGDFPQVDAKDFSSPVDELPEPSLPNGILSRMTNLILDVVVN